MLSFLAAVAVAAPPEAAMQVALTFDDLPYITASGGRPLVDDPALWRWSSDQIRAALRRAEAPASVFVNCDNLGEHADLVTDWARDGFTVANHTATHRSANRGAVVDWAADVDRCSAQLAALVGEPPRLFRYPYLRRGKAPERRAALDAHLQAVGLQPVPVTAASSEWLLAHRYDQSRDPAQRQALYDAYVPHMLGSLQAAQEAAIAQTGADVPHILLLHVNELTADALPALLSTFRDEGVEVIPVEQAMAHPFYAPLDDAGAGSLSWLHRRAPPAPGENWFWNEEVALGERFPQTTPEASPRLVRVSVPSALLGRDVPMRVLLPEGYDPERAYPLVVLLHGADSHFAAWSTHTPLLSRTAGLEAIVAMPDGGVRSMWLGTAASHVLDEVLPWLEASYRLSPGYGIAGLSMGGYGAWALALRAPETFSAAVSITGTLCWAEANDPLSLTRGLAETIYADGADPAPDRILARVDTLRAGGRYTGPALMSVATEDALLPCNRSVRDALGERGVPLDYQEAPGGHTWAFFDTQLPAALAFLASHR